MAIPTFSTMPDVDIPRSTWPDVGRHRGQKMAAIQTGSGNNRYRPTSGHVDRGISTSGMVENVVVAIRISLLSNASPEIQCTSGLNAAILFSGCRRMSVNVENITVELGMVENMGVVVGISLITCPKK